MGCASSCSSATPVYSPTLDLAKCDDLDLDGRPPCKNGAEAAEPSVIMPHEIDPVPAGACSISSGALKYVVAHDETKHVASADGAGTYYDHVQPTSSPDLSTVKVHGGQVDEGEGMIADTVSEVLVGIIGNLSLLPTTIFSQPRDE